MFLPQGSGGHVINAAPGVWRRPRNEIEQDIIESCCGMQWDDAVTEKRRLFRLRVAVLQIFEEAGRRGR